MLLFAGLIALTECNGGLDTNRRGDCFELMWARKSGIWGLSGRVVGLCVACASAGYEHGFWYTFLDGFRVASGKNYGGDCGK